jgi:16S rRNA processing protein RimM
MLSRPQRCAAFASHPLPPRLTSLSLRGAVCPRRERPRPTRHAAPRMGSARRPRAPRARTREDSAAIQRDDPWTTDKLGFVLVGTIVGAHGVRGEAKVRADTDFARQRLGTVSTAAQRYLLLPGRRYPRPVEVRAGRKATQEDVWILQLDGISTREAAEERRGSRIYVKEEDRPRMSRDEYLVGDLVGMRVALAEEPDVIIGCVRSVVTRHELCAASGAGAAAAAVAADLLEIALGGEVDDGVGEATLVPFVKQIVPMVSRRDGLVLLTPPDGLLEIAKVNNKYKPPPPRGLLCAAPE